MNIKKTFSLLAIALAVSALAAPAAASAAVWKDKGVPLKKPAAIFLFGGEVIEAGLGTGVSCAAEETITMLPGSTGQVTEYRPIEEGCTGFGELAECEVVSAAAKNLPWDVDVNTSDLTFTGTKVNRVFDPGCPIEELESKVPQLTVTLESPPRSPKRKPPGRASRESSREPWKPNSRHSARSRSTCSSPAHTGSAERTPLHTIRPWRT